MKNNACLEYLKKLLEKGLIRQKESQNGHKEYFIVNSYIYLWYAFVYTAKLKAGFAISDQTIIDFDEKLRKEVYRRFLGLHPRIIFNTSILRIGASTLSMMNCIKT